MIILPCALFHWSLRAAPARRVRAKKIRVRGQEGLIHLWSIKYLPDPFSEWKCSAAGEEVSLVAVATESRKTRESIDMSDPSVLAQFWDPAIVSRTLEGLRQAGIPAVGQKMTENDVSILEPGMEVRFDCDIIIVNRQDRNRAIQVMLESLNISDI